MINSVTIHAGFLYGAVHAVAHNVNTQPRLKMNSTSHRLILGTHNEDGAMQQKS